MQERAEHSNLHLPASSGSHLPLHNGEEPCESCPGTTDCSDRASYTLGAPIGSRGSEEKSSFITSPVAHVITLENVPKKLPGWQAIFYKTRHHTYMNMKECVLYTPSSQSSIMLFAWWEMVFQRDQWCRSCVMYLTMFQPQILPLHFSLVSTGQEKLMAESLPQLQVSLWLCPWRERCITGIQRCPESLSWGVIEEWQTEK